jgi:signal transduction histidine kinase
MRLRQQLAEIQAPVRRALALLSPHFEEIRSAWQKRLAGLGIEEDAYPKLAALTLESQQHNLRLSSLDAFRHDIERQGLVLERNGIPMTHTAAALAIYLDCCLPYLIDSDRKRKEPAVALARLISTSLFLILSSCATERTANWRRLQDRERHSLSRDLHDEIGHNLLVLKLYLEMMTTDLKRGDVSRLESKLEEALALVSYAVDSVRRLLLDLGPAMLAQFGFVPALKIYTRQFTLRTAIQVQMEVAEMPGNLPSNYETALYRVLQGSLSNVVNHSHAKRVKVRIGTVKNSVLVMSVEDDGSGFDLAATYPHRAFGLTAMRERIEMLGGKFHIESWPLRSGIKKHGTRIEVDLPLPAAGAG